MTMKENHQLSELIINTIRTLSMDAVQKANSGHPGTPMALAPVAFTLYNDFMKFNPAKPDWPNRDRFILSAGHASMLLYSVLHVMGYDVTVEDLQNFRQLHSKTPGHPEFGHTPGVEMTTGPLGQGAGTSVGMAIAEKWLKAYFNRPGYELIDYRIFALVSDGCIMEGISHEAASLAGHLGLDNLIWIYDNNGITIEGSTSLTFSEDVSDRFNSYGWFVQHVSDANDLPALRETIQKAMQSQGKPSLIIVDSHIAYGAPKKQDTAAAHGEPLGEEEIRGAKAFYGWDADKKFYVPEEVQAFSRTIRERGERQYQAWQELYETYRNQYGQLAQAFELIQKGELPQDWDQTLPVFPAGAKGLATRQSNGTVLNAVAAKVPWLLGGAADLLPSTKTGISGSESFCKGRFDARNFHFGIREHAMGAIVNGIALSKLRPFGATFFVFSDYMRPSIRLAALMKVPSLFIFTHDSIGLGEDGPTHQPVEHLASLRAMPNLDVVRPADANEVSMVWRQMMRIKDHPIALVLTRQNVPTIDRSKYASAEGALKGAYIVADGHGLPEVILIASGSEVHLCLQAFETLKDKIKLRVVSMPCWEWFEKQSEQYKRQILPPEVEKRVAVEAGATLGWHKYVGSRGIVLGIDQFGLSAPYSAIYKHFGLTAENIIDVVQAVVKK